MSIVVWIVSGLLALAFVAAGVFKATKPVSDLRERMGWVDDVSPGLVKAIGVLEILGGIGLVLPELTGIAPILTPLAAFGLAAIMLGAIVVHARRRETQMIVVNVVLLALSLFVAFARLG